MVTVGGTAKLLDFGVAKRLEPAVDVTETTPGAVLGTPAYMSPEQVEGQPVDARSDIFSFGAVLYEILAGRRPFAGNTTSEVIAAILRDDPPPLGGPPALARVVMRCLAKNPADRYQTMAEVSRAVEDTSLTPAMRPPSIAVLPFANLSGDKENEYFSDGLAEEIITELTRIPGLKVIARTSAFAFKGRNEDVRGIAEALGVTKVLEGSVRRAGDRIRVTAQLISAADGTHLWSERYDRSMSDVFAIQDEIAQSIAKAFRMKMAEEGRASRPHAGAACIRGVPEGTKPAFQGHARFLGAREGMARSGHRTRPGLRGPAHGAGPGLFPPGVRRARLRDLAPTIRAEAHRALALNPSDPQPNILLGSVAAAHDYDWNEAAARFRDALRATPVSPDTRWAYASMYLSPFGRFDESVAEMERAVERDPLNAVWRAVWSDNLACAESTIARSRKGSKRSTSTRATSRLTWCLGRPISRPGGSSSRLPPSNERTTRRRSMRFLSGCSLERSSSLATRTARPSLIRQMGDDPLPVWGRVLYHLVCGEIDAAADWFERMLEHREPFAVIHARAPIVKPLRDSPRWRKLSEIMNLRESA